MSFDSENSAISAGKFKRSLNSNLSNPAEEKNKRKKTNNSNHHKTLGMAWGANSFSSSKSSTKTSPFTDFGSYMDEKNRKLLFQFQADASNSSFSNSTASNGLFHGISIFVDGFTVPSSQELRGYMLNHGGRFENYFSRHRVTHIICSNLPDSKIKNIRSFSKGLPVVKPTWLLDSVAANRVLDWIPYQLDELVDKTRNQQKLSSFFNPKSNASIETAGNPVKSQLKFEQEASMSTGAGCPELRVAGACDLGNCRGQEGEESACLGPATSGEVRVSEPSSTDPEDQCSVREEFQSSPRRLSATVSSCCLGDEKIKEPSVSRLPRSSDARHSTLRDPNFVDNYFKCSRLHFIGTWRNRYRKRFPNMVNANSCRTTSVNGSTVSKNTAVIHIDMDCFFVSVIIRNHPELQDKPVAVCHSDNPKGTAEISSANYPARDYGVKAGIFVRDAKALCPHLVIVPYNFEAYEEVADQFYNILHKHCNKVQAVSCDEAFLDVTNVEGDNPEQIALMIRQEIFQTTGCTASAGIAGNLLLARLATRNAKPNGQCLIPSDKVEDYLINLSIKAVPGIGRVLQAKLKEGNIETCGQLRMLSKESLQKDFGVKTGDMLWHYSRGLDNRMVDTVQETKSIGAEVNWGVRFNDMNDSRHFLTKICKEVSLRLRACGMQGRTFTLKIRKRRKGAEEPAKFMGCGDCDNLSHSVTVPSATDDVDVLLRISKQLFALFHSDVKEIRGIGLQVSRLETADLVKQGHKMNALKSWLSSASEKKGKPCRTISLAKHTAYAGNGDQLTNDGTGSSYQDPNNQSSADGVYELSTLPPISHLDLAVLESLPPEVISEINEMYNGRLIDFMEGSNGKGVENTVASTWSQPKVELKLDARNKGKQPLQFPEVEHISIPMRSKSLNLEIERNADGETVKENFQLLAFDPDKMNQVDRRNIGEPPSASVSRSGFLGLVTTSRDQVDLMPSSLSQVDISVLQQLPDELKHDILGALPPHRTSGCSSNADFDSAQGYSHEIFKMKNSEVLTELMGFVSESKLWTGNPPRWVADFRSSNCFILNIIAKYHDMPGSNGLLSSTLQCLSSSFPLDLVSGSNEWDEAFSNCCELLRQYIELKIKSDIEEIYICFRLLKRFTNQSTFLFEVFNMVLPFLQDSVRENYGGTLLV